MQGGVNSMAKMIPATVSQNTSSKAEKRVFKKLSSLLDDSFTVFHSVDILAREHNNKLIDAEIDFLILSEKLGILVVEVKGGVIKYNPLKKEWNSSGHKLNKSPYVQAKENKYIIQNYLIEKLGVKAKRYPIGYAVCFPDIFVDEMNLPPEGRNEITITGRQIKYLDYIIPQIMERYKKDGTAFNYAEYREIRKTLLPAFEYGTKLSEAIERDEEHIFTLTDEQCNLLDFLDERKRVLIKGYAGTGKTVLALKKARELAEAGNDVLLLCFNVPLSKLLKESIKNVKGNIETSNYHAFCIETLNRAGIKVDIKKDSTFWQKTLPNLFYDFLRKKPIKYDAIIVDEGQDFFEEYWITIEEMLKDDSYFYIFYDPYQNLYGTKLRFPIEEKPFVLKRNCRNTKAIFKVLSNYSSEDIKINERAPEGVPVNETIYSDDYEGRKKLQKLLHHLVNEEKIRRQDIVILGGHSIEKTCLKDVRQLGNFTIVDEREEAGADAIRYFTYLRYKGCESPAVILLDVDPSDDRWSDNGLYTAISRARTILNVLRRGK
ncbi:MAG: DUF2075 domain-containing protein [Candidatus Schekmanbacteria bacterium]|nr:MAG: DUF2075 domain-containing protein [Candidatus Schekmanbacteria bacterium]